MQTVMISLPGIAAVKTFVEALSPLEGDFDLISGRYILDAKSLMGILNLDLSQPLRLDVHRDTEENMQAIQPFLAKEAKGKATEAER